MIIAEGAHISIGDRLLTDVVFANVNGMKSVLVGPLSYVRDHPAAIFIRYRNGYIEFL
jgi:predicted HAD superfamily phosphohydrolase YqeG